LGRPAKTPRRRPFRKQAILYVEKSKGLLPGGEVKNLVGLQIGRQGQEVFTC